VDSRRIQDIEQVISDINMANDAYIQDNLEIGYSYIVSAYTTMFKAMTYQPTLNAKVKALMRRRLRNITFDNLVLIGFLQKNIATDYYQPSFYTEPSVKSFVNYINEGPIFKLNIIGENQTGKCQFLTFLFAINIFLFQKSIYNGVSSSIYVRWFC
jgi:hypothetical protein